MTGDELADQIEADLRQINALTIARAGDPKSWITCNVIVIEDMEQNPVGYWARFLVVPRVGEWVSDGGVVEQVNHHPASESSGMPAITLFVRRTPSGE